MVSTALLDLSLKVLMEKEGSGRNMILRFQAKVLPITVRGARPVWALCRVEAP